jgi:hypothetical protein
MTPLSTDSDLAERLERYAQSSSDFDNIEKARDLRKAAAALRSLRAPDGGVMLEKIAADLEEAATIRANTTPDMARAFERTAFRIREAIRGSQSRSSEVTAPDDASAEVEAIRRRRARAPDALYNGNNIDTLLRREAELKAHIEAQQRDLMALANEFNAIRSLSDQGEATEGKDQP